MSKIPQIKNENHKKSETVPLSSGETKKNGLSPIEVPPLMKGLGVVAVVVAAYAFGAISSTSRKYIGGFRPQMTSREAALILGVRGSTSIDKVTEAHRRLMVANHPDMGGSHYLASKINEAKDKLIKKHKNTDSVFSYKLIVKEEYSQ